MKQVFRFKHDVKYMDFVPKDASVLVDLCGPATDKWIPPKLEVDRASRKLPRGEFLHFSAVPQIVTEKTREILEPYISDHVEFLPIPHDSEIFLLPT